MTVVMYAGFVPRCFPRPRRFACWGTKFVVDNLFLLFRLLKGGKKAKTRGGNVSLFPGVKRLGYKKHKRLTWKKGYTSTEQKHLPNRFAFSTCYPKGQVHVFGQTLVQQKHVL
jgi:hypothetical protein